MASESKCSQCGSPAAEGASFCSRCGGALPAGPRPGPSRGVAAPERASLAGNCSVIYAGQDEMDIRRIGRIVADAVERPLPDVTRDLKVSKGFFATGLPAEKAVVLADRLEKDLHAPILVIPDDQIIALPPALRMRDVIVSAQGLTCSAYAWDRTETLAVDWAEVFLISCGRMEMQRTVSVNDPGVAERVGLMSKPMGGMVVEARHEFMLDIVLQSPWRRLRLDQNLAGFSLTELKQGPEGALASLYRVAMNLERHAEGVPRNPGLALLAAGGQQSAWTPLTFFTKRDFDAYTYWLIQIVRYGRPVPA